MFHLRRAALRLAASPSASVLYAAKPRAFASLQTQSLRKTRTSILSYQYRWASDAASTKPEESITSTSTIPIEDNPTPMAEQNVPEAQSTQDGPRAATGFSRERPTRARLPPAEPSNVLYVGNLFFDVTDEDLSREFSKYGDVLHSKIVNDVRGLSKGFGYITFGTIEQASAALENLNQQLFEGRRMSVQFKRPDERASQNRGQALRLRKEGTPSRTLFVGNLSFEMTDQDLNELFRDVRNVIDVRVAIDRRTGQPRGFAHADFIDIPSAERAKELLAKKVAYGRQLRVDFSHSVHDSRSNTERRSETPPAETDEAGTA